MLASFIAGIMVARYLGPEKLGLLSYAQSFVILFSALATLGLDGIIVRELVQQNTKTPTIMGTGFLLKLIGASIAWLLIGCALWLINSDAMTRVMVLIIAGGLLFQSLGVIDFYYQSQVISKYSATARILSVLVSVGIKVLLIVNGADLFWFALVVAFDAALTALFFLVGYKHLGLKLSSWKFDITLARELLSDSWPLILSGLMVSVYMRIDQIMINHMLDSAAVGIYNVGVRLTEIWFVFPVLIVQSVFPSIIKARQTNRSHYIRRLQALYDFVVGLMIIIAIPIAFFSQDIVNMFFGIEYQGAGPVLCIQIWAGIFVALGVASSRWLLNENLNRYSLYRAGLGSIVNVILNLILIPYYGILGASLSTVISYMIAIFSLGIFPKTREALPQFIKALFFIRRIFAIKRFLK